MLGIRHSTVRAACLAVAACLAPSPLATASFAQDAPTDDGSAMRHAYRAGHVVDGEITLDDVFGENVTMLPKVPGKLTVKGSLISVFVFWSLRDPVARGYVPKLMAIQEDYRDQDVVVYLIDSNHDEIASATTDPLEKIRGYVRKENVTLPILVDKGNLIADQFGAICAGEAFVIGFDRRVKYVGAIDDDPRGKLEREGREIRPWVQRALDAVLEAHPVETPYARPHGRPIKRAPE